MSTPQLIPNLMQGNIPEANKGIQAMGMPPVGNAGGSNLPGATATSAMAVPGGGMVPTLQPAIPGLDGTSQFTQQQQTNSNKQLTDVFGKGIGGDINSVINNLGSNDSTYMQAYTAAMAPQNAEGLATLNTSLANSGVGADSSTTAIADADFEKGVTSQEGLQEAQLQQTDQQNLIGLLQGTQGAANKEASTSVWGDIGSVLSGVGTAVDGALGPLGDAGLI